MNTVADTLSRMEVGQPRLAVLSGPTFSFYTDLRAELENDADLRHLRETITETRGAPWRVDDGLILCGRRVFISATLTALATVLQIAHTNAHEGVQKTLHRLRADFVIDGDHRLVREYVWACAICQHNKSESLHPVGLLQPLDVPALVWSDISMDFVEGLPKVHGKSVILTVVDRLSKYAHFIALGHPYTAASVARAFFSEVVRLHGFPSSIISDRGPVCTGHVWRDLFKCAGIQLQISTAFHPQTDGQ